MFTAQLAERDSRHRKEQFTQAHTHMGTQPWAGWAHTRAHTHTHEQDGQDRHTQSSRQDGHTEMSTQPQAGWAHTRRSRVGTHTHTQSLKQDGHTPLQEQDSPLCVPRLALQLL